MRASDECLGIKKIEVRTKKRKVVASTLSAVTYRYPNGEPTSRKCCLCI